MDWKKAWEEKKEVERDVSDGFFDKEPQRPEKKTPLPEAEKPKEEVAPAASEVAQTKPAEPAADTITPPIDDTAATADGDTKVELEVSPPAGSETDEAAEVEEEAGAVVKKSKKKLLIVLAVLAVVGAAAFGFYQLFYNSPGAVQRRAEAAVTALYNEDESDLAEGVAGNSAQLNEASLLVNKVSDEDVKATLSEKVNLAQKMADTQNGIAALYSGTGEARQVVRSLSVKQVNELNTAVGELSAAGKQAFAEKMKAELAPAKAQADLLKQIDDKINELYVDGAGRKQLKESATVAALDEIKGIIGQLQNADTQKDLNYQIDQMKPTVEALEAEVRAKREAEEAALRKQEEDRAAAEAAQAEAERVAAEQEAKRQEAIRILQEQLAELENQ